MRFPIKTSREIVQDFSSLIKPSLLVTPFAVLNAKCRIKSKYAQHSVDNDQHTIYSNYSIILYNYITILLFTTYLSLQSFRN